MRTLRAGSAGAALEEIPEPVPGPGQVLARPLVCGICGIDLHLPEIFRGRGDTQTRLMLGHEFCAEILDYGPRTERRIPVGARVVSMPLLDTGRGTETIGLSSTVPGGFSDRMLLAERLLLPVPDHVPDEHAALVEPLAVGQRAVAAADLGDGDVALVLGCGPVGCAVIAALTRRGVPVVAADPAPTRRAIAGQLGADIVVDPDADPPVQRWRELGAQDLPYSPALAPEVWRSNAVLFECVGRPGMLQQVIASAPGHARIVCVGVCHEPDTIVPSVAVSKELTITFAFAYRPEEFARALDLVAREEIDAGRFVSGVVELANFSDAFAMLRQPDNHLKLLIRP
jgi:threonine dehydrogenase-like Zn-dependent dehydrogenase